jgi:hypothetical protein
VRTKPQGRKTQLITDVTSTALGKEEMTAVGYLGWIALRREQCGM